MLLAQVLAVGWPGFSENQKNDDVPRWGLSFDAVVDRLRATIVDAAGADAQVVLVGHDWGAYAAMLYAQRYRRTVARLVLLDVGVYAPRDQSLFANVVDVGYKGVLCFAFACKALGVPVLGLLAMASYPWRWLGPCPHEHHGVPPRVRRWFRRPDLALCYPYFHLFKGLLSGTLPKMESSSPPRRGDPAARGGDIQSPSYPAPPPTLYLYGTRKRIMFHSAAFLRTLDARKDGSRSRALDCGHYLQAQRPDDVAAEIHAFIFSAAETAAAQ
mmetsp:Transcript_13008/g.52079  ORF Transcript_13008/g.52079 Transcript_13008/m.52079 type:complete len:271 (-) Transcript_13008:614-1426(-)